jgi:hypothetical protein
MHPIPHSIHIEISSTFHSLFSLAFHSSLLLALLLLLLILHFFASICSHVRHLQWKDVILSFKVLHRDEPERQAEG